MQSSLSAMTGFDAVGVRNQPLLDVPPPLPPRLHCTTSTSQCHFEPSSSRASSHQQVATKCIDEYHLFPCARNVPHSDFDANSVGFVDIQELRELDDSDDVSLTSLPVPVRPRTRKRKPLESLRKLIPECCRTSRRYGTLNSAIKNSTQDHNCLEIGLSRKSSAFYHDSSSVVLPCPPPTKKRSFQKTFQKFMFCGSR